MLVLTRKLNEEIVIDGHIRIRVVEVKRGKVRLGITAPESVRVDRHEIQQRRAEFAFPAASQDTPSSLALGER